jgi:TRAP-type C4-dicarboxylate transport system substrate-binding protein
MEMGKKIGKILTITFLSAVLILSLSSYLYAKAKVLKCGHVNAPTSHYHASSMMLKELVEKKSKGALEIEVYPAEQLGTGQEHIQGMALGTIAIHPEIDLILGNIAPYYKLWAVFYICDNLEEAKKLKMGPFQDKFNEQLLSAGIRQIGWYDANWVSNLLSKKPIYKLEDLQGLKNRSIPVEAMIRSWKALGTSPVATSYGEVYTSLATNLIHAMDNPIADMWHERFHEPTDYLCMTQDLNQVVSWNVSEKIWQTLTPSEQQVVLEAVEELKGPMKEWCDKDLQAALAAFKEDGIETINTDLTGFAERIGEKIDYILSGDKELIDMYWQIRNSQSK